MSKFSKYGKREKQRFLRELEEELRPDDYKPLDDIDWQWSLEAEYEEQYWRDVDDDGLFDEHPSYELQDYYDDWEWDEYVHALEIGLCDCDLCKGRMTLPSAGDYYKDHKGENYIFDDRDRYVSLLNGRTYSYIIDPEKIS